MTKGMGVLALVPSEWRKVTVPSKERGGEESEEGAEKGRKLMLALPTRFTSLPRRMPE